MYIKGGEERLYNNLFRQLSMYWDNIDEEVIKECTPLALSLIHI